MEGLKAIKSIAILLAYIIVVSLIIAVNGQIISTPCTTSMVTTFTPCLNFLTGSSSNGTSSPSTTCCSSLKSILSSSVDCACLLVNANVPIQLPINRTLAISLPQACNVGGIPIQCKPTGSPLPAPGATLLGPTPAPTEAEAPSPFSPQASEIEATAPAPLSETADEQLTPTLSPPPEESEGPSTTANAEIRPELPSAASGSSLSYVIFPTYLNMHIFIGAMFFLISY